MELLRPLYVPPLKESQMDNTNLAKASHAVCDICGRSRNKGNHRKCSRQRQRNGAGGAQ